MKIVFFGSSDFAVPSLERLVASKHDVVCVVTQPDRKKGRGFLFSSTVIKATANKFGLQVSQPERIDSNFIDFLKKQRAEIFVVISYGKILPKRLLSIPKKIAINVHASLLPKYRGAAPINWAIVKGEKKTGISIIKMNEFIDEGQIISREEIPIDEIDTAQTLKEKLSHLAAKLLVKSIDDIEQNNISFIAQDHQNVSYAPKLKKIDGEINWSRSAREIRNQIRGMIPWPGSFTHWQGKLLKIWKSSVVSSTEKVSKPGEIIDVTNEGILVATGKDILKIEMLQLESGKTMSVAQFICGHSIKKGDYLS
jgi:methionyl-tRNA formyltransferase